MTFKRLKSSLITILITITYVQAGLIRSYHEEQEQKHHFPIHHSVATSYMHFHGPVEGPEFEFKVPYVQPHYHHHHQEGEEHLQHLQQHDHQPQYVMDYVAHPKYEFSYGVEDHHTGDFHSQKESRDGSDVSGVYSVAEPGGGVRIVTYRADKHGFHADVQTHGKNNHQGATYQHHGQAAEHQEMQQEYPAQEEGSYN